MTFTREQRDAIESSGIVSMTIDGIDCVVIRADAYDRMRTVPEYDDSELNPRDLYPMIVKMLDAEGSPQDAEDYKL